MYFERKPVAEKKPASPFDIDLKCNINIETHVAMRLGELILVSGTEDKQLLALGHRLSKSMSHLVDQLDDLQWHKLKEYIMEQTFDDDNEVSHSGSRPTDFYSNNARKVAEEANAPINSMKDFVRVRAKVTNDKMSK
jgi:hypothetical protein